MNFTLTNMALTKSRFAPIGQATSLRSVTCSYTTNGNYKCMKCSTKSPRKRVILNRLREGKFSEVNSEMI